MKPVKTPPAKRELTLAGASQRSKDDLQKILK
jgi:hypothetical protein